MSKSNFEKSVALGGAVTAVFGVLSSLNPHLAYSRVDFIIDTLRTSFVLEFQPLPFTIGLLLSGFGGILGLVAAVKWRGASRLLLRLGSLLGCVGLLVFLFEFYPGLWRIAHARGVFVITFGVINVHGVGFYLVLFGSLLMLERATMGGILRRIAVGASATSLALLVLVLCMFFSPPLDLAYPLFLNIVGLLSLLGGLLASIGTALSLVLIYRSKKDVKILGLDMKRLAGVLCAILGIILLIGGYVVFWYEVSGGGGLIYSYMWWSMNPYRYLAFPLMVLGVILTIAGAFLYFYTPKETQRLESMNNSS